MAGQTGKTRFRFGDKRRVAAIMEANIGRYQREGMTYEDVAKDLSKTTGLQVTPTQVRNIKIDCGFSWKPKRLCGIHESRLKLTPRVEVLEELVGRLLERTGMATPVKEPAQVTTNGETSPAPWRISNGFTPPTAKVAS